MKLKYLFELDVTVRLTKVLEDLYKQQMFKELEIKIDNEVKRSINESQKEYYLREKMKVIQEELGDKAKKEADIEALRKKILDCKMPKQMEEKALNNENAKKFIKDKEIVKVISIPNKLVNIVVK